MVEMTRRGFATAAGAALAGAAMLALAGCGSDGASSSNGASSGAAAASSAGDAAGYKLVKAGTLTVGSDLAYPPMEYLDGDQPAGFGVAMTQEVCKRLGLACEFLSPQNFDTLITQVAGGTKMDAAVSSITITDERREEVAFSDPYYDSNQAIVVLGDASYEGHDELNGQPIGVQSGTSGEDWVRENLRDSEVVPYNTPAEALAGLRAGKVEAVVYDEPVASNNVSGEYSDCRILEVIATGEQYGIALNKDNTALVDAINGALADMEADGTMDELRAEWIEGDGSAKAASSGRDASAGADGSAAED